MAAPGGPRKEKKPMLQLKVRRVSTAVALATVLALAPATSAQAAGNRGGRGTGRIAARVSVTGMMDMTWDWIVGGWGTAAGTPSGPAVVAANAGGGIDPNGGSGSGGGGSTTTTTTTTCTSGCKSGTTVP